MTVYSEKAQKAIFGPEQPGIRAVIAVELDGAMPGMEALIRALKRRGAAGGDDALLEILEQLLGDPDEIDARLRGCAEWLKRGGGGDA